MLLPPAITGRVRPNGLDQTWLHSIGIWFSPHLSPDVFFPPGLTNAVYYVSGSFVYAQIGSASYSRMFDYMWSLETTLSHPHL